MNAISHIQAAAIPNAVPATAASQYEGAGETVFQEAMHQALKPENKPAQNSQKATEPAASHSSAPLRSAPSSARTAQPATSQTSQIQSSRAAWKGSPSNPVAEDAQVSGGSDNSDPDASAGLDPSIGDTSVSDMQLSSTAAEFAGATSPGTTTSGTTISAASYLAGKSPGTAKNTGAAVQSVPKSSIPVSSLTASQPAAAAMPPAVAIMLPSKGPNLDSTGGKATSSGGTGTTGSAATIDYSHAISHPSTIGSNIQAKTNGTQGEPGLAANASTFAAGATQATAAAADIPTTVSSSDLLLNSSDETTSSAQSFALESGDASSLDGVVPGDAAGVAGNGISSAVAAKVPDALGNFPGAGTAADVATMTAAATHSGAPGHSGSIDSTFAGTSAAAGSTATANGNVSAEISGGNLSSGHLGASSTATDARIAGRSASTTISPSATFSAMDRAGSTSGGSLLHASPNQVTVGIADGGMGWIEVRAERVGGQVTAALTANSATAHAELTSVLPAMNSYLQDHRQPVQQITVETGQAASQNTGSSQEQSNGGRRDQGDTAPQAVTGISGASGSSRTSAMQSTQPASHDGEAIRGSTRVEGHQLSVRA